MIRIAFYSVVAVAALAIGTELGASKVEAHPYYRWYRPVVVTPVVITPAPIIVAPVPHFTVYFRPSPLVPMQFAGSFVSRFQADAQVIALRSQGMEAFVVLR
jgi:hypothetical protein